MAVSNYTLGLIFICIVTVIWTAASFLTQYIYSDLDFQSPFVLTYLSSSLFSLYLPLHWCTKRWFNQENWDKLPINEADSVNNAAIDNNETALLNINIKSDSIETSDSKESILQRYFPSLMYYLQPIKSDYSRNDLISVALILSPLWMLANCLYNYSLLYTSIGSSTIISNLSGVFTLFFSYISGVEEFSRGKLFGLLICFLGVILVSIHDNKTPNHTENSESFIGDMLAIVGAMGYGLYTTVIKLKIGNDSKISMQLIFGYLGIVTSIVFSLPIIFLLAFRLDHIYSLTGTIFGYILLECIFDGVIADYLWARSVLLTTPTVATVGLSLTIPLAIVSDVIIGYNGDINALTLLGASLVTIGFVVINLKV